MLAAPVLFAFMAAFQEKAPADPRESASACIQAETAPGGLAPGEWTGIRAAYEAGRHAAYPSEDGYRARNPGQQWRTHFDGRGFTATPDEGLWTWGLELCSYGFEGAEIAIEGQAHVRAEGSRVTYEWDGTLEEWYVNDQRGLEHGYTVHERPPLGADVRQPLAITLAVRGSLRPEVSEDGRDASFVDELGGPVLTYAGLTVFDAGGRRLPARMQRLADGLRLVVDERDARYPLTIDPIAQQAYLKASNTDMGDSFGSSVSISGNTVVVGAFGEASSSTGVNGDQGDDSAFGAGAAYVFVRNGTTWVQQAYLKASNTESDDGFGFSVSISADTIVVGAPFEDSIATGVNGDQDNEDSADSGAAYVFVRSGTTWAQQAYLKASNTEGALGFRSVLGGVTDVFGHTVSVSGDTIVVGAYREGSNATGVNGDQDNNAAAFAGAAYVFARSNATWSQQAYLKASNTAVNDQFGISVSVSGETVVVGAWDEDSNATGVNGDESDNNASASGAAYVFVRNGTTWTQQAYLKASNTEASDNFGWAVSISSDTLVVGAYREDSNATGVNGDESNNGAMNSGAVYVFVRSGTNWSQQAYLKASSTQGLDSFGLSLGVSGNMVIVGAPDEDSNATGVNGDESNNSTSGSGAAYVFVRSGTNWSQQAYVKASNPGVNDRFGGSVSASGDTLVVGANGEASNATGVNGDESNNSALGSGAAYVIALTTIWTGATDSDWTDDTNWTDAVPDTTRAAIIPDATTTPNDPVILVSGQTCNTLWVQTSGTLDISAGMDSLGVVTGSIVDGPITGTGQLVFEADATLTGTSTIGLTFLPAVRADANLELLGGPLSIAGSLLGNADVTVTDLTTIDIGGSISVIDNLSIDGSLTVGDSVTVGDTLASSSSGGLVVLGSGDCISAGQVCYHGGATTSCSLQVENLTSPTTSFDLPNGWVGDVGINVVGTVNLLTSQLTIGGDLVLREGTFAVAVNGTITASGIVVESGAILDITGFQTLVPALTPITVKAGGKLNIREGGELLMESNTLTIESGGTLCLDGTAADSASFSGYMGSRYTLALLPGSTLAAKGFAFRGMAAAGIVIGPSVNLAAAPFDLRAGLFDDPAPGGVLLDIERSLPKQLRYLRFENTTTSAGPFNVRTPLTSAALKLVNWSGAFAGEPFEDDPGVGEPGLIEWGPPEESDVQDFSASWASDHVKVGWTTLSEVDSAAFILRRSPEPPGVFVTLVAESPVGPSSYRYRDYAIQAATAYRYRLYELLTHGEERLIDELMLPAGPQSTLLPAWGSQTPAPPPLPLVVGPGGAHPDVPGAIRGLARSHRGRAVTLELASVRHEAFELDGELTFDLRLVAQAGAVIDASRAPLRIHALPANRTLELDGLVVDAREALHPALVVDDTHAIVLFQDVVVHGNELVPALRLRNSTAVALQGGSIEGALALELSSRATASGVALTALELTGHSTLETRGRAAPGLIEPGSTWLAHDTAPFLTIERDLVTLETDARGLAWLGSASRLAFQPFAQPLLEGVVLLDTSNRAGFGSPRPLIEGRTSWNLGALPPGAPIYLQCLTLDTSSARLRFSDVLRATDER